jgi:hypothetical protein
VPNQEELDKAILQAETSYICDPDRRPIEYWHQEYLEPYGKLLDWTRRYALDNKWAERRQAFWRGVQLAWLKQKQEALLQTRVTELLEAQEFRTQVYQMIKPRMVGDVMVWPIEPKSWEGVARAWIQLDGMIEDKRDAIMQVVDPMLGKIEAEIEGEKTKPQLPFSGDEMRRMAHNLLEARRRKRRSEMPIEEYDETTTVESGSEEGEGGVEGEDGSRRHERVGELDR